MMRHGRKSLALGKIARNRASPLRVLARPARTALKSVIWRAKARFNAIAALDDNEIGMGRLMKRLILPISWP